MGAELASARECRHAGNEEMHNVTFTSENGSRGPGSDWYGSECSLCCAPNSDARELTIWARLLWLIC